MCWMCDRPDATFADYVDEVLQPIIDRCGWAVQAVGGSKAHAPFSYTVGLTRRGLPELVVTGKRPLEAAALLNTYARYLVHAVPPSPGEVVRVDAGSYEVVGLPHPEAHLFLATGLYEGVEALQLVWPDDRGVWPWQRGHRGRQPVLGPRAAPQARAG